MKKLVEKEAYGSWSTMNSSMSMNASQLCLW